MVNKDENDNVIGQTSLTCHTANALPTMVPLKTQFYWPNTLCELFMSSSQKNRLHSTAPLGGDCSSDCITLESKETKQSEK